MVWGLRTAGSSRSGQAWGAGSPALLHSAGTVSSCWQEGEPGGHSELGSRLDTNMDNLLPGLPLGASVSPSMK